MVKPDFNLLVYDDVRIQFYHNNKSAFHFWFNTFFIDRSGVFYINKDMIDGPHKDKKNLMYDKNFSIKVYMTQIEDARLGRWENKPLREFKTKKKVVSEGKKIREEDTMENAAAGEDDGKNGADLRGRQMADLDIILGQEEGKDGRKRNQDFTTLPVPSDIACNAVLA